MACDIFYRRDQYDWTVVAKPSSVRRLQLYERPFNDFNYQRKLPIRKYTQIVVQSDSPVGGLRLL